jgi:hypothetical protein
MNICSGSEAASNNRSGSIPKKNTRRVRTFERAGGPLNTASVSSRCSSNGVGMDLVEDGVTLNMTRRGMICGATSSDMNQLDNALTL